MSYGALIVGLGNIGLGYDLHQNAHEIIKTHARALDLHDSFILKAGDTNFNEISENRRNFFGEFYTNKYNKGYK